MTWNLYRTYLVYEYYFLQSLKNKCTKSNLNILLIWIHVK